MFRIAQQAKQMAMIREAMDWFALPRSCRWRSKFAMCSAIETGLGLSFLAAM
jgi:hypothetical protein